MDNNYFLEESNIKQAFLPVDLNAAAVTGARVGLAKGKKVAIVITMGDSTAALAQFSFQQHNAASAGTSKALSISNKYYYKKGAETSFTQVEPSVAASSFDLSTQFAGDEGVVVFEVNEGDLDVENDFNHISVDVADSTAAKIAAGLYILENSPSLPAYSNVI